MSISTVAPGACPNLVASSLKVGFFKRETATSMGSMAVLQGSNDLKRVFVLKKKILKQKYNINLKNKFNCK